MPPVRQAFIGGGSNLGDRATILATAFDRLRASSGITALELSSVYETDPVGIIDQPKFLNVVGGVETTLTPEQLLDTMLALERTFGRVRAERWGPRLLDLDLLVFEGESRSTTALQLPHPRILERSFVTVPLRELLSRARFRSQYWMPLRRELDSRKPSQTGVHLYAP